MKPLLHIALLLMTLMGTMGQSTALAMMPARGAAMSTHQSFQVSMADMDCTDMATMPAAGKSPCKKMTLQCMAAMGCALAALVEPQAARIPSPFIDREKSVLALAARLWGREYGPEPDPPSFLI